MSALKRIARTFLANTPLLLLVGFPVSTGLMLLDFLIRFSGRHSVDLTSGQVWRLCWTNLPWIVSITVLITIAYGLLLSTAVKDLSDPMARASHVRRWLFLSLLAGPVYFWHLETVLPEGNHQARRVRSFIVQGDDSASIKPVRSGREMGIGRMLAKLHAIPARLDSIERHEASPERKARRIASLRRWSDTLRWEIAKKIQMTFLLPVTAALALSAGLLLRTVRKGLLRLSFAIALAKAYIMGIFRGMGLIERHIEASGFSAFVAWTPFACLALAALACGYWLLRNLFSKQEPPCGN